MWAATMTQLDLLYATHQLNKFSKNPGPAYWKAARKALKYLLRTRNMGFSYRGKTGGEINLSA